MDIISYTCNLAKVVSNIAKYALIFIGIALGLSLFNLKVSIIGTLETYHIIIAVAIVFITPLFMKKVDTKDIETEC